MTWEMLVELVDSGEATAEGAQPAAGTQWRLNSDEGSMRLGRDPQCRIMVDHPLVSRGHLEVACLGGRWFVRDMGSLNGTYDDGGRISYREVVGSCRLTLGGLVDCPAIVLTVQAERRGRSPSASYPVAELVRIGRAPDNTVVLNDLMVSRCHAEIQTSTGCAVLRAIGTGCGTFVNGHRVTEAELRAGDIVSAGRHQLRYDGQRLTEYVDSGRVHLRVDRLTTGPGSEVGQFDGVSFELAERTALAVLCPSAADKSALLGAMTGLRPATAGAVYYDGRDFYLEYDDLRNRIGLVPADDVLNRQLTVRMAVGYAAALRFGADLGAAEREARVTEVLDQLGLAAHAERRIDQLGSGQRRLASVAAELLADPSVLFLDGLLPEGTSAEPDRAAVPEVIDSLRALADRGRTVVVFTEEPLDLDRFDQVLVLAPGGLVGYFGPPSQVLDFFAVEAFDQVLQAVADDPEGWARRHAATLPPRKATPVAGSAPGVEVVPKTPGRRGGASRPARGRRAARAGQPATPGPEAAAGPDAVGGSGAAPGPETAGGPGESTVAPAAAPCHGAAPARQPWGYQLGILTRRTLAVAFADRGTLATVFGLPLGLAALVHLIPGTRGLAHVAPGQARSGEAAGLLAVLVIGAVLLGLVTGISQLVDEAGVYRADRMVGLRPSAYLGAKALALGALSAVQAAVFVLAGMAGRAGPDEAVALGSPMLELIVVVWLTALVASMLALLVGALAASGGRAVPILIGLLVVQLVFSGGLFDAMGLGGVERLSWLVPSKWGYAAAAATTDLRAIVPNPPGGATLRHTAGTWFCDVAVLIGFGMLFLGLTRLALRRNEPCAKRSQRHWR